MNHEIEVVEEDLLMEVPVVLNNITNMPTYETEDSAGMDLKACIDKPIKLKPGKSVLIPTGIKIQLPKNYELQVRPRSGLALKHGITVLNTPGTVDSDYRGDVGVILINHGKKPFIIENGMRIAQGVVNKFCQVDLIRVDKLTDTRRGEGGFGHTGV